MGFDLSKMLMGFAKSSFKAATKKERKPLRDEYDFREEYENEVDEWEAQVDSLNDIYNEWDYEQDPAPFRQRFEQEYAEIQEYLKTTVKTFLAEHSAGYRKSDINIIYKELVEQAKEIKADFMSEYPSMVSEYKEFLKEEEERRQEEEQEAAEWAAFNLEIEKLNAKYLTPEVVGRAMRIGRDSGALSKEEKVLIVLTILSTPSN
mgnify:CR=1 FL=1